MAFQRNQPPSSNGASVQPNRPIRNMGEIPKVALLIETARSFGRELLRGIARYSRMHGPWAFHITPGDFLQDVPKMRDWGGTGIIARIANERIAEAVIEANVPTIALGLTDEQMLPGSPLANFSEISSDSMEVARVAADHLLARQLTRFAYVGAEDRGWSSRREKAFCEHLQNRGFQAHVYRQPDKRRDRVWEREQRFLLKWIRELPTPIGLFACDDDRGREVLEVCKLAGLHVPEHVAVVGVDNDEVFCDLSNPPLSSVALNVETAGFRAAALLDEMMRGNVAEPRRIVVESLGVVVRRSTEVVAVEDEEVALAMQFIHSKLGVGVSVEDVVKRVAVSRRNLENRFRTTTGRTILEEIQIVRLERAKRLLIETNNAVSKVAEMTGFGSTPYFIQFFRKRVGKTPSRYRGDFAN